MKLMIGRVGPDNFCPGGHFYLHNMRIKLMLSLHCTVIRLLLTDHRIPAVKLRNCFSIVSSQMSRAAVMEHYVKTQISGYVGARIWVWLSMLYKLAYCVGVWNYSAILPENLRKISLVLSIQRAVLILWKTRRSWPAC